MPSSTAACWFRLFVVKWTKTVLKKLLWSKLFSSARVEADQKSQSIEPQRHHTGAAPSGETDANGARHREQIALQEQILFVFYP